MGQSHGYSEVMLGFSGVGLVLFWMVAALTVVPALIGLVLWAHDAANDPAGSRRRRLVGWAVIGAILSLPMIQLVAYGSASVDGTEESAAWADGVSLTDTILLPVTTIWS